MTIINQFIIHQHWFDSQVNVLDRVQLPGTIVMELMQEKQTKLCAPFRKEIIVNHTFSLDGNLVAFHAFSDPASKS